MTWRGKAMERKHPMQRIVRAKDGVIRFQSNAIVRYLLDSGPFDLNHLATLGDLFDRDDWEQFAQLIGYSVSGAAELDYVSDETCEIADRLAARLERDDKKGPR